MKPNGLFSNSKTVIGFSYKDAVKKSSLFYFLDTGGQILLENFLIIL